MDSSTSSPKIIHDPDNHYSIVIIGGGIIGLATAFEIASKQPLKILLVDQGNFIKSASYNAAGILATQGAQHFLSPLRKQIVLSSRSYPQWLEKINKVLGMEDNYKYSQYEYSQLNAYYLYDLAKPEEKIVYDNRIIRLTREQANDGVVIDGLHSCLKGKFKNIQATANYKTICFKNDHVISPPKLLFNLSTAITKLGVSLFHGKVENIDNDLNIIIAGQKKKLTTDKIIFTGGSETSELLNKLGYSHRLKNLLGYILVIEPLDLEPMIIHFANKRYFVQRKDFAIYGSLDLPLNHANNNPKQILLQELQKLFPQEKIRIKGIKSGCRPYYDDKYPLLGYLQKNIFICSAHYKSGLALAPLHAQKVAEVIVDGNKLDGEWEEFTPLMPARKRGLIKEMEKD